MPYGQDPTTPSTGYGKDPTKTSLAKPRENQPPAETSPLSDLWESLKGYGAESLAALSEGARALPGEAARVATDIGQALLPGRGGAEAGGRVLEKIGDVGTFLSGGLQNPLGMPVRPQFGERVRGLGTDPRVAQVPQQRALPPPSFAMGQGGPVVPPSPAPVPQRMLPAPGNLATAEPGVPAPSQGPRLALPPPTSTVAGAPGVSTGTGLIPPGPGSTMRPTFPQSSSLLDPLGPTPMPSPRTGAAPVEPPFEPSPRPGAKPAEPLVQPGAEKGRPSQIATAFASNDGTMVDRATASRFRRLTNTRAPGRMTSPGLTTQDQKITTAVDTMIDNRDSLRLKDPAGRDLPAGRLPRSLDEFLQGVDHLKDQIFDQYDQLAKQQGGRGVQVPLQPAIDRLLQSATQREIASVHPDLVKYAQEQAQRWAADGSYSPKEMQNLVQHLNAQLKDLQRNPTAETYSRSTILSNVLVTLRESLNTTMATALQGPQYQALRNRYGSLAEIEGDVARALRQHMANNPALGQSRGLIERATDLGLLGGAVHFATTFDPKILGTTASVVAARELSRYLRSPNRAVTRLFSKRASDLDPTTYQRLSAEMATRIADIRQRAYDANVSGNIAEVQRLGNQRRNLTPPGSGF